MQLIRTPTVLSAVLMKTFIMIFASGVSQRKEIIREGWSRHDMLPSLPIVPPKFRLFIFMLMPMLLLGPIFDMDGVDDIRRSEGEATEALGVCCICCWMRCCCNSGLHGGE